MSEYYYKPQITLRLIGPLPNGRVLKRLHDLLPKRNPVFSEGITHLEIENMHFKAFSDLLQLIRDLPSVGSVRFCKDVTWDGEANRTIPSVTWYSGRCWTRHTHDYISYQADIGPNCMALVWMNILLSPHRKDRLNQHDADTLCRILPTALLREAMVVSDYRLCPSHPQVPSSTHTIDFGFRPLPSENLVPKLHASAGSMTLAFTLCFRADGSKLAALHIRYTPRSAMQNRQVQVLVFNFRDALMKLELPKLVEPVDWASIDMLASQLNALQTFLVVLKSQEDVLYFHNEVAVPKMPHLRMSHMKYLARIPGWYQYRVAEITDEGVHLVGPSLERWEDALEMA
ncbi:hypothetical protein EIP86_008084 [Pleurotus ostreatoroseus]|nr:hypothetical protein EIP86_008084 [Pleurotus ostreatoroseus]